jgi:hypothetical protein
MPSGALLPPIAHGFAATVRAIDAVTAARIRGRSWRPHPEAPELTGLAHVTARHRTPDGGVADGELIVAAPAAPATVTLLARLYTIGFPLTSLALVDDFDADDDRSMEADNSSALNVRTVAGTARLSDHARGIALDLNPRRNPMVWPGGRFVPPGGAAYLDRRTLRPGMIVRPGPVTAIFDELGWEWGGDWAQVADLHHVVWRAAPWGGNRAAGRRDGAGLAVG